MRTPYETMLEERVEGLRATVKLLAAALLDCKCEALARQPKGALDRYVAAQALLREEWNGDEEADGRKLLESLSAINPILAGPAPGVIDTGTACQGEVIDTDCRAPRKVGRPRSPLSLAERKRIYREKKKQKRWQAPEWPCSDVGHGT